MQELFNTAVGGVLTQGMRCSSAGGCHYRLGPLRDPIGFLIDVDPGDVSIEEIMHLLPPAPVKFYRDLQHVHDMVPTEFWIEAFGQVAQDWGLTYDR